MPLGLPLAFIRLLKKRLVDATASDTIQNGIPPGRATCADCEKNGKEDALGAPPHMDWLQDTGETVTTADGRTIEIWELNHAEDEDVLSAWAKHFREHYCPDDDLAALAAGTGKSHADFLTSIIFPDAKVAPGPSVRSGDFAEILVADFIEYILDYWCPRELRYADRFNRNDSTKGCDVVGFKFVSAKPWHKDDELFVFESKGAFTATKKNRLQDAVDDSGKDLAREAMTLNALKQRMRKQGMAEALKVQRFQNETEQPFKRISGAAAVLDSEVFESIDLGATDASKHPNVDGLRLIAIRGPSMMSLVHALYERAANEA